jgi:hypothetical protein
MVDCMSTSLAHCVLRARPLSPLCGSNYCYSLSRELFALAFQCTRSKVASASLKRACSPRPANCDAVLFLTLGCFHVNIEILHAPATSGADALY